MSVDSPRHESEELWEADSPRVLIVQLLHDVLQVILSRMLLSQPLEQLPHLGHADSPAGVLINYLPTQHSNKTGSCHGFETYTKRLLVFFHIIICNTFKETFLLEGFPPDFYRLCF